VSTAVDSLLWRLQMADREAEQQSRSLRETTAGMRELVTALVHTEEVVRAQLAADIHDTVAQSLALAKRQVHEHDGVPEKLADAVEDAEEQVRAIITRTGPVMLEGGDLAAAVRALGDDVNNRYGLQMHLVGWPDDDHAMPVSVATVCYRFVQEAVMNVTKHANTDECFVSLSVEGRQIAMSVIDHGGGFDPAAVKSTGGRHVGLHLLGERARLMGGNVEISSAPGEATVLRLRLTVPERRATPRNGAIGPEVLGRRAAPTSANA
ncbi:MAG TPA: ATP-binding protein, partial [Mycobacteriales bacterium]|nr:ATP-binding protein [Mycobacteriales bacterium]